MAQTCVSQKLPLKKSVVSKFENQDIKAVLAPLLVPIINQIAALNDSVKSLMTLISRKDDDVKKTLVNQLSNTSITTDVSLAATNIHRLSKNCDCLKQQMSENKEILNRINIKLCDVEKLISSLVKRQTKKQSLVNPKVSDLLEQLESCLLSNVTEKSSASGSATFSDALRLGPEPGPMQLLTLNSEHDFPQGAWLGDPTCSQSRVRCPLREEDLVYINTKCTSPEKMALALLDYLFTKETLASSNLSGKSKLGKKQLDPLMIYGIKCHLVHHFNINEKHWERIKLNMDSKCRSAWKKRRLTSDNCISVDDEDSTIDLHGHNIMQEEIVRSRGRLTRKVQGDIEVVRARPDQVLRLHDFVHNVHVLDGDHILPIISSDGEDVENGIQQSDMVISQDADLHSSDTVNFVMEPMLEVLSPDSIHERYISKRELEPIV